VQARYRIELLGGLRVEQRGRVISQFRTQKTAGLLAYLAYFPQRAHPREELIELLWPECDPPAGRNSLSTCLWWLRRELVESSELKVESPTKADQSELSTLNSQPPTLIVADRTSVGLNAAIVTTDVAEFEAALQSAVGAGSSSERAQRLARAVDLYQGELLPGHFDDWILQERPWLAERYFQALRQLLAHVEREGDVPRALEYAHRGVGADPLREETHCELMRLYAAAGQPDAALRQYRELERLLKQELYAPPSSDTRALVRDIKRRSLLRLRPGSGASLSPLAAAHAARRAASPHYALSLAEGENRLVTILFADVSRSVEITQGLHPEDAAALVSRLLQAMVDVLLKYEGQVDRFLRDGVLAVFGTPLAHEDDPERAIRAALEIRTVARRLGLEVHSGINTGEVYLGGAPRRGRVPEQRADSGSEAHREAGEARFGGAADSAGGRAPGVMGPAVNLAARLQEQAEPGQILVGQSTYRIARGAFEFSRSARTIKGIAEPVVAYAVDHAMPRPEKARGIEGRRADLIGRDEELAQLKRSLDAVLRGQGQMMSLIGEAGLGKSRLIAELKAAHGSSAHYGGTRTAHSPDQDRPDRELPSCLWLEGRCLELGMTTSYTVFVDLFQEYFAWPPDEDESARVARICASLQQLVDAGYLTAARADEVGPLLANLFSLRSGDEWDARLKSSPPEQIRYQTFLAIRDFLLALTQTLPVVLALEDLHWADSLSLDLLPFLMEALPHARLFLLCVYRPEREHRCRHLATIAERKCSERYRELHLRQLTPAQSRQMVASLLVTEQLPAGVLEQLLEKAGGNPFFLEEVVRALIDAGVIRQEGSAGRAREALTDLAIPESLQILFLSRVDRLEPELKEILQAASVIGRLFPRRLLEYTSGQTSDLDRLLWELEERGLIYQERAVPEEEYSFHHVLTQQIIYQNLVRRQRAAFHLRVAEAIEHLYREGLEAHYEELAYHYERSGPERQTQERALDALIRAADRARRAAARHEEAALLARAIVIAEQLGQPEAVAEMRAQRGRALAAIGGALWPEARREMEAALEQLPPERHERRAEVLANLSLVCVWLQDAPETRRHASEALALAEEVGRRDLAAMGMSGLALADSSDGELESSVKRCQRAMALAAEARVPPEVTALERCSIVLYWLGRHEEAITHARKAIDQGRSVNDTSNTLRALGNLGLALSACGRYQEALQVFNEARQLGREHGLDAWLARAIVMCGGAHLEFFDYAGAEALAEEGLDLARSTHLTQAEVSAGIDLLLNFARCREVGRTEKLIDRVGEGVRAGKGVHGWQWRLRFTAARAEIALARGDQAEAVHWAEETIERSRARHRVKYEVTALATRGKARVAQGRAHDAIADLEAAIALARPVGDPAMFLRAATALLELEGDGDLAAEARAAAKRIAAALPDDAMRRRFAAAEPVRLLGRLD
jgi:DNA-binding SARP family transcriptional activator